MDKKQTSPTSPSRRQFIKKSGVVLAGATLTGSLVPSVHAAENNTLNLALVGCGGRGTGATSQALKADRGTKLVAMADVFEHRVKGSRGELIKRHGGRIDVPAERQFVGMDAFRKAIDAVGPGGVILLATPPVFRPLHFEYAVEKDLHVFMEKSFGVDFPGAKRVLAAGERAKEKNLKIATGLMTRHCRPVIDTIKRIHDGEIGDIIAIWCYRMQGSFRAGKRREGVSELAYQIQNFNCFPWLNGSLMLDWLIHSIDVACWAKGAWPVSAQGQGGRSARTERDQMYDHFAVDYTFPDGTKLMAMVRQSSNCYDFRGVPVHGTKGSALVGEKFRKPAVYSGYVQERKHATWRYRGPQKDCYQVEHNDFFRALRNDEPYNETDRSVKAAMASMLGRMAAYSGKLVTWDEAMASGREMTPGIDQMTMDSPAPVKPDKNGAYPLPKPGMTKVLH